MTRVFTGAFIEIYLDQTGVFRLASVGRRIYRSAVRPSALRVKRHTGAAALG
jgi:hypothetical protein